VTRHRRSPDRIAADAEPSQEPAEACPPDAVMVVREIWPDQDGMVIICKQYRVPARWWHPVARGTGIVLILFAICWPVLLLSHGWIRTGAAFAVADLALIVLGWELMSAGKARWLE